MKTAHIYVIYLLWKFKQYRQWQLSDGMPMHILAFIVLCEGNHIQKYVIKHGAH